jgi:hypothetical protein
MRRPGDPDILELGGTACDRLGSNAGSVKSATSSASLPILTVDQSLVAMHAKDATTDGEWRVPAGVRLV